MNIREIRLKLGLTQEDLAHRLGVTWGTIARWESGKGKPSKLAQRAIENFLKDEEEQEE